MDDLPDDAFEIALDARTYVYLQSILALTHPLKQIQIENKDLETQWKLLRRGKREIDPGNDFYFLEKQQILEHGLKSDFVARLDLATFAHEVFTDDLNLERCKKGLQGFSRIFLPESAQDHILSSENGDPLLTIFLQFIATILVLHARYATSSETITRQNIMTSCNSTTIPELSRLSKMNVTPVIDLATRVSNDNRQLLALYNDILKRIIRQMSQQLQSLDPITATDFAEELNEIRKLEIGRLYKNRPIIDDEYEDEIWLSGQDQKDTEIPSSPPWSDDDAIGAENLNLDDNAYRDTEMLELEQTQNDNMEDRQYTPHIEQQGHSSDKPHKSRPKFGRKPLKRTVKNAKKAVSRKIESDSDFEEGNEELSPRIIKRYRQDVKEEDDGFVTDLSESDSSVTKLNRKVGSSSTNISAPSATGAGAGSSSTAPKTRKPTVHWTDKEVSRLLELVEDFRYEEHEILAKKRTVKWSRLKSYDENHGNVLRLRSQVQLKDKYRELTDNGAHRRQIMELVKARKPA
ncbi:hypothetical protein BGX27_006801 [Mortierella sp. AM989]|nr:hypothetical protein BGX27_006801 [Mortierella sp. AM989]